MAKVDKNVTVKVFDRAGKGGLVFLMAYIGAAIYFIQQSDGGFWDVILALLQALVWPVYFVFHVLQVLGA
jgi:hypothetical protein